MTETQLAQLANQLKALAHPQRIRILLLLLQQPSQPVSALQQQLNIKQSTLSYYLIKLKAQGILARQRRNPEVHYSVANPALLKSTLQLLGLTLPVEQA